LLRLEQARRRAVENHVHRIKGLGRSVMINETWYQLMVAELVEERDSPSGLPQGLDFV
jgi:hypothetical protein